MTTILLRDIESMKVLAKVESGALMLSLFDKFMACSIRGISVERDVGGVPMEVSYEFADGTKITWSRPG